MNKSADDTIIIDDIGGLPHVKGFLQLYVPYTMIHMISTIIGTLGNLFLIVSVLSNKSLRRNPTCILITNLAFADLLMSLLVHPSMIAGVFFGRNFFHQKMVLCSSLAAICLITCCVSLITMGVLAFNRYICIFYSKKYKKLFSIRNTVKICILSWFIGALIDLPNFLDIGDHVYDPKTLACHFDRLKVPFTLYFTIFCIFLPAIIISYLHLRILFLAYSGTCSICGGTQKNATGLTRHTNKAIKIAKSLFITSTFFFICWIPFSIILLVDLDDQFSVLVHAFGNSAAHFHSTVNPIVYLLTNPMICGAYRNLICKLTCNRFFARKNNNNNTNNNQSHSNYIINNNKNYIMANKSTNTS